MKGLMRFACCFAAMLAFSVEADAANVSAQIPISECDNVDGITADDGISISDCYYALRYDNSKCSGWAGGAPCDNLVIYFSGGGMDCSETAINSHEHLQNYYDAADGYVLALACTLQDITVGDNSPFYLESGRVDTLVERITALTGTTLGVWSGKNLLITGVSHGAAAVASGFARSNVDSNAHMTGTHKTGVCLYDAPVGAITREGRYQADLPDCHRTRNRNVCHRYRVTESLWGVPYCDTAADWGDGDDECASPLVGGVPVASCAQMALDQITAVSGRAYAHNHWKFVSCGDVESDPDYMCTPLGFPDDGPSRSPMAAVCSEINARPFKSCDIEHHSVPDHSDCAVHTDTVDACRTWFEAL